MALKPRWLGMALAAAVATSALAAAPKVEFDTATIEALTGAKGALNEKEGVFKVAVPRSDLSVTAAGVQLTPPMGLTSWAAFTQAGQQVSSWATSCCPRTR